MRVLLLTAVAAAVLMSGCATITRGRNQDWSVVTSPDGARVTTSNGFRCEATPCNFRMPRQSRFVATVSKPGYQTVEAQIDHRFSNGGAGATAGNVLLGGGIGLGVDAMSGANQDIRPNPFRVTMTPGEGQISMSWEQAEAHSNGLAVAPTPPPGTAPR